MENSQRIILSEIKETISSMYKQIYELENKLGEIEIQVDKALGVESVAVEMDFVPAVEVISDEVPAAAEMTGGRDSAAEEEVVEEVPEETSQRDASTEKQSANESERMTLVDKLEENSRLAVMDVMAAREPWRTDRPGSGLKDIRSAISLNDRALFINYLFREDPSLFLDTVSVFNSMERLDDAVDYLKLHFPEWDMQSEVVYRFMMAVRRKLR